MRRRALGIAGIVLMASTFVTSASGAQDTGERVELTGTGAWSVNNQMNLWKTALYSSRQATDLSYLAKGDRDGRQIFARGDADFVVSGVPLTADDTAKLAERKVSVISAPFSVASAALLMSGPYSQGLQTFTQDPDDPEEGTFAPYTGTLRLPDTTLARILLDRGYYNWVDPDFVAANKSFLPAGSVMVPPINPTAPLVRSDPSATNFFMLQFTQQYAPQEFLLKVAESKLDAFQISESWPFLSTGSRTGSVNTANLVAGWQNPKEGVIPLGGVIAATPVSEALNQKANYPGTPLFIPEIQNAAGEWVGPTPQAISLAVDKGDGQPLAAMHTAIPGAYPLVWVNRLYAPASGLGVDRTNAVATLIRYAVTVGQSASDTVGEGRLSEKLVSEALTAADAIVAGNCTGSDRKVIAAADGGPLWPAGATMPVGSFTVCAPVSDPAPAVTTTSTTVATRVAGSSTTGTARPSSSSRSYDDEPTAIGPSSSLPSGADDTPVAETGATTDSPTAPIAPKLASVSLPLRPPSDGRGALDRLSTMLLGGACLLLAGGLGRRRRPA
ncbi:MAG: substrate-binding domain-containing protein [Acidimicrobiales bacterium]